MAAADAPWGTMTRDLWALADGMAAPGVTPVAMESTGVYGKPISNILESRFRVLRVKARHLKQVPGRKSDGRDGHGIAQRLQHGLLKGSFIPPRRQREWRDLPRLRVQLVEEKTRRLPKELEDANLKLASGARDILGASGRAMLEALIEAERIPGNSPIGRSGSCGARSRSWKRPWRASGRTSTASCCGCWSNTWRSRRN